MATLYEIQHLLQQLSKDEREAVSSWLRSVRLAEERVDNHVAEPRAVYALAAPPFVTLEEYFEFEEQNPLRHEYVNGAIYAMSGASVAHARISRRLLVAVEASLRGGPCEAFGGDLRLLMRSDANEVVYIPDLMVACKPEEWGKNFVSNPKLVAEILSPSTEHIDRREKSLIYRSTASIEEYVLLGQDDCRVTVYRRADQWRPELHTGRESVAQLRSIGLSLPLSQLYDGAL